MLFMLLPFVIVERKWKNTKNGLTFILIEKKSIVRIEIIYRNSLVGALLNSS